MDACITAWQDIITHQLNSDTKPCNLVMLMLDSMSNYRESTSEISGKSDSVFLSK